MSNWNENISSFRPVMEQILNDYRSGKNDLEFSLMAISSNMYAACHTAVDETRKSDFDDYAHELAGVISKYDPQLATDIHQVWRNRATDLEHPND